MRFFQNSSLYPPPPHPPPQELRQCWLCRHTVAYTNKHADELQNAPQLKWPRIRSESRRDASLSERVINAHHTYKHTPALSGSHSLSHSSPVHTFSACHLTHLFFQNGCHVVFKHLGLLHYIENVLTVCSVYIIHNGAVVYTLHTRRLIWEYGDMPFWTCYTVYINVISWILYSLCVCFCRATQGLRLRLTVCSISTISWEETVVIIAGTLPNSRRQHWDASDSCSKL